MMDAIQEKENIYNTVAVAVEEQQVNVENAKKELLQIQNDYLKSVVNVAISSEKVRRKKDRIANIVVWIIIIAITLGLLWINLWVGVLFLGIAAVFLLLTQTSHTSWCAEP